MWYDVYVDLNDDDVLMYAGIRGEAMTKIVDTATSVSSSTDRIEFIVNGASEFHFDDIKVMVRELGDETMALTFGPGNQMTSLLRADGVEIEVEYDAWN